LRVLPTQPAFSSPAGVTPLEF